MFDHIIVNDVLDVWGGGEIIVGENYIIPQQYYHGRNAHFGLSFNQEAYVKFEKILMDATRS